MERLFVWSVVDHLKSKSVPKLLLLLLLLFGALVIQYFHLAPFEWEYAFGQNRTTTSQFQSVIEHPKHAHTRTHKNTQEHARTQTQMTGGCTDGLCILFIVKIEQKRPMQSKEPLRPVFVVHSLLVQVPLSHCHL